MSLLLEAVEAAARAVAGARHARAAHPRGRTFTAEVRVRGGGDTGVGLLDRPGTHPAVVRLSRGAGLPAAWPDVLGLAVRVLDIDGAGRGADLLFSSVGGAVPVVRHVPLPRRRLAGPYSTVSGYDTRRGRRYLEARADPAGPRPGADLAAVQPGTAFLVTCAPALGRGRVVAVVRLGAAVPAAAEAGSAFDPVVNDLPDLRATGALQRLRRAAYRGSRRGRGVSPDPLAAR